MNHLRLSKINQLHKYNNYEKVDYRNSIFKYNQHRLDEKVVGAGNHDSILSNKKDKTFMTFDSKSPFGKKYNELYYEKKIKAETEHESMFRHVVLPTAHGIAESGDEGFKAIDLSIHPKHVQELVENWCTVMYAAGASYVTRIVEDQFNGTKKTVTNSVIQAQSAEQDMIARQLFNEMAMMFEGLLKPHSISWGSQITKDQVQELSDKVEKFRNEPHPHPLPWCAAWANVAYEWAMGQNNASLKKADTNARFCIVCGTILDPNNVTPTCSEKCSDIALNKVNIFSEAIELLKYFVDRVDAGTIRSTTTYKMYKDFLGKIEKSK